MGPRVYVQDWDAPPMAAGAGVPEMVLAAGGEPFNRSLGQPSAPVTWEELMEFDPQLVVYAIRGKGLAFDPAAFLKVEGWNTLSAARAKKIFSVDDSYFNEPGKRARGERILRELIEGKPCVEARGLVA
jgi:iron complex transport system substrate-binding protein